MTEVVAELMRIGRRFGVRLECVVHRRSSFERLRRDLKTALSSIFTLIRRASQEKGWLGTTTGFSLAGFDVAGLLLCTET